MLRLNGLDFHVEVAGDGSPLLLLHGFTGSLRTWDALRSTLGASTRVIAMDLIGHGRSAAPRDPERYTLDLAVADVAALLDSLELDSTNVLGYSMGGRLALQFAVTHPKRVRALILESASPGIEDERQRHSRAHTDDALAERILRDGIPRFVEEWERLPLLALADHVPEHVRAAQHALRLLNNPLGLANSLRGMGAGRQSPLWFQLPALRMPVSLIVGERDAR